LGGTGGAEVAVLVHVAEDLSQLLTLVVLPMAFLLWWMRSVLQTSPKLRMRQRWVLGLHALSLTFVRDPGQRWWRRARVCTDTDLAQAMVERAAARGEPHAHLFLGRQRAAAGLQDPSAALAHFRIAAEAGLPAACHEVAEALRWGLGGPKDPALARKWFERAARAGHRPSVALLASALATGDGLEADEAAAARWRSQLARMPEVPEEAAPGTTDPWLAEAQAWTIRHAPRVPMGPWVFYSSLGVLAVVFGALVLLIVLGWAGFFWLPAVALVPVIPGLWLLHRRAYRPSRKLRREERRGGAGSPEAAFALRMRYRTGSPETPQDLHMARDWPRQAAEAGHVGARVQLADLLAWGAEGAAGIQEAQRLLEAAGAAGHPEALTRLRRLRGPAEET